MDVLLKKLKRIKSQLNITNLMINVVGKDRSVMNLIVELNTQDQLFDKGIDSLGKSLEPPYSPFTVRLKQEKGQPTNRVTLKDTGDFYNSFSAFVDSSADIIISSDSIKYAFDGAWDLLDIYGKNVEGLTQQNLEIINTKLIVPIQKYIKSNIL